MIYPFQGWTYTRQALVAPVRDALSETKLKRLYEEPYQAIHIALPQDPRELPKRWAKWVAARVIALEPLPAFYAYAQTFHPYGAQGGPYTRLGLLALVSASTSIIKPHERTLSERAAGIIQALRALPVQSTPVHLLAKADWVSLQSLLTSYLTCPRFSIASEEGVMHRLTPIQNREHLELIQAAFLESSYYIADGHHRYEAVKAVGLPYLFCFVSDVQDPSLWIPSAHRLVETEEDLLTRLETWFDKHLAASRVPLWQEILGLRHAIGLLSPDGKAWTLRLRPQFWGHLAEAPLITWLHRWLLDPLLERQIPIDFARDLGRFQGKRGWVFVLPPIALSAILASADQGHPLPPKATYFFPKVLSGLVFYLDPFAQVP